MIEFLPILMFVVLAVLLFSGFPVAWVLGGIGLAFAFIGMLAGEFRFIQFFTLPGRIFGTILESMILTAVPMFIFMGLMLEKSGVARDLLNCLAILLRKVPGGLALSVTLMGTVLAASTGIIGASVVMMTVLALPVMLERSYATPLATGTIAASGCLGILIPPSIMLVILADLLSGSVGILFMAAILPGLLLASLYSIYVVVRSAVNPSLAPRLPDDIGPQDLGGMLIMVMRSFIPPVILIMMVLGSILFGLATPTEAAGVGALGATLLAVVNLVLLPSLGVRPVELNSKALSSNNIPHVDDAFKNISLQTTGNIRSFWKTIRHVMDETILTNAMIFGIFIGATLYSYIFRALGGDDLVISIVDAMGLGSWGLLLIILAIVFFLGFFFDWIEITLIVLPIFMPIINMMDFGDHVARPDIVYWIAILIAVNLQTSFLTPPFGFAIFFVKAAAPSAVRLLDIYRGVIPFVLIQLFVVGLVFTFPQIAMWLPRAMLN